MANDRANFGSGRRTLKITARRLWRGMMFSTLSCHRFTKLQCDPYRFDTKLHELRPEIKFSPDISQLQCKSCHRCSRSDFLSGRRSVF